MSIELKQIVMETIAETAMHPKTAWLVVAAANTAQLYGDLLAPALDGLVKVLSLFVMAILIRKHWLGTKKIELDIEKQEAENKEMREAKERSIIITNQ